jgi:hypothetical protein
MIVGKHSRLISTAILAAGIALGGCTSIQVKPVTSDNTVDHICIQNNAKVIVSDFIAVMQEGFTNRGITSEVYNGEKPARCLYTATYVARQTWDFAPYIVDAQIDILRDGRQIASGNYHMKGKGGFALNKWAGTRTKILPVIEQLLAQVTVASPGQSTLVRNDVVSQPSGELARKLAELKDAYDVQLITREEYEAKRKELLGSL